MRKNVMEESEYVVDMNIYEASEFWDEHDFEEFDGVQEVHDLQFSLKKKRYVGIDRQVYDLISVIAKQLHTTEDILINQWLHEKVPL